MEGFTYIDIDGSSRVLFDKGKNSTHAWGNKVLEGFIGDDHATIPFKVVVKHR